MWCDGFGQFSDQVIVLWYTFIQKQSPDGENCRRQSHHMILFIFPINPKQRLLRGIIIMIVRLIIIIMIITIVRLIIIIMMIIIIVLSFRSDPKPWAAAAPRSGPCPPGSRICNNMKLLVLRTFMFTADYYFIYYVCVVYVCFYYSCYSY